ncbi:ribose-phosphate pyrophosphokinase 1 [Dimargaris cristalligena]|uniref:Ribose-phosphate pyrophosphokinase 1 n=1 Tax=Dimargaris cristalligena TaxID=215637 RepID=A0A4Q0A366_9FUNG|nr:ribose-phosphate pyrophosphokinase 1 [Dimargaris cristalligena]RKP40021.1 phosphoribosyltransferase-like protein [Dimargaris cristalligena]|eukprot:RKP40021.1 phosphoribosyltransferase-like protein [Dimargaris cristalligena]
MKHALIFSGSSHPELTRLICDRLGSHVAPATLKRHKNHESSVELGMSVRDKDVYIVQSGSNLVNDHIMELLILIHACQIASARKITAVLPYFPYSKQSKKKKKRGPITAKLLANMLSVAGVDHVITMDLHASQMQGFFRNPVDNLYAEPSLAKWITEHIPDYQDAVVVAKNAGGAKRVTSLADCLHVEFALIHADGSSRNHICRPSLERFASALELSSQGQVNLESDDNVTDVDEEAAQRVEEVSEPSQPTPVEPESPLPRMTLVGDVTDKLVLLMDDMVDSSNSFLNAAHFLKSQCRAKAVYIVAVHGILSGESLQNVQSCPDVDQIIVTNTLPIDETACLNSSKLKVVDVSNVFAEAIRRTHNGESISYLFQHVA